MVFLPVLTSEYWLHLSRRASMLCIPQSMNDFLLSSSDTSVGLLVDVDRVDIFGMLGV